jgi:hypothetical protein
MIMMPHVTGSHVHKVQSAPVQPGAPADPQNAAPPETLLPDPARVLEESGDPGAQIAALAIQTGSSQRRVARDIRDTEEANEAREEAAQVKAIHDKATSMRTQASFDGVMVCAEQASGGDKETATWFKGIQTVGDGLFKADQTDHDADAVAHASAAEHYKLGARNADDCKKDAGDYIKAALDFYREYVSTQAQTQSAALHRA